MRNKIKLKKVILLLGIVLFLHNMAFAEDNCFPEDEPDTVPSHSFSQDFIHRIGIEIRPEYILPTNRFFKGENFMRNPIRNSFSTHLKYSFQFQPNTITDQIYGGAYQGIGLAYYNFDDSKELGSPVAFYLFQGARIAQIDPRLSFNYEWNFGLSAGWKPYDVDHNNYNVIIGSKVNAYLNADFYLNWMVSPQIDLSTGFALNHFSNGNTKYPNAGMNSVGLRFGLVYNFNRKDNYLLKSDHQISIPEFPRHISYDLVLFGSWRRKGVAFGNEQIASPNAYTVLGFNFAPMYNFGYKFRAGVSLDGVYDESANAYALDYIVPIGGGGGEPQFSTPPFKNQIALGLSGRAEYVMPYFTIGLGLGANVIHSGGDLKSFYQILALKAEITRSSFIHIGYSLQNFHTPNFLMLGIGYRFNNKYPTCHRRH